jgi:hypothetical protein
MQNTRCVRLRWMRGVFGACAALLVLAVAVVPAAADIAPPARPPGANLVPGSETTQVRMEAETVVLDVQRKSSRGGEGEAKVTADFMMHNLGQVEERMEVRFPLTFWDGSSDGSGNFPEIRDAKVFVAHRSVATRRVQGPAFSQSSKTEIPWLVFQVSFPAGSDVPIRLTYTADGMGETAYVAFKYVLETGSGWNGTIGSADLIVRLPYQANAQNVVFDEQIGYSMTSPGGVINGRQVQWHYDDLEPTYEQNLEVSLVKPAYWEQVLQTQDQVNRNPRDGEAWGQLGKAAKAIISLRHGYRQDAGGQELYRLSRQAYEQAVTRLPGDALWHLGFADLLFGHYYWHVYMAGSRDLTEMLLAAQQISQAYSLKPGDQRIIELLDEMTYSLPGVVMNAAGSYDFPILTSTPAPDSAFFPIAFATPTPPETEVMAAATLSATISPTGTMPSELASPTPEPTPRPVFPFCSSAGMALPILVILPLLTVHRPWRRRQ